MIKSHRLQQSDNCCEKMTLLLLCNFAATFYGVMKCALLGEQSRITRCGRKRHVL